MSTKTATKKDEKVSVVGISRKTMNVHVRSLTPLVQHAWSSKAIKQMEDKHAQRGTTKGRTKRVPEQEYKEAFYVIKGKPDMKGCIYGIPAASFRQAMESCCGDLNGRKISKKLFNGSVFVRSHGGGIGGCVAITKHTKPFMRQDVVRNDGPSRSVDLRYRPEFEKWECQLEIEFDENLISAEQIINLLHRAGFSVGVGEMRPERAGEYGRFEVVGTK